MCSVGVMVALGLFFSIYTKQKGCNRSFARKGPGGRCPRDHPFTFVTTFPLNETYPQGLHEPRGGGGESSSTRDMVAKVEFLLSKPTPPLTPVVEFELPPRHFSKATSSLGMIEAAFDGPEDEGWTTKKWEYDHYLFLCQVPTKIGW